MARTLAYSWSGRADPAAIAALDDGVRAQFASLGLALQSESRREVDLVEIWDVNWPAFVVFRSCATQWRVIAGPRILIHLGLDYSGVDIAMRRLAPADADQAALFADIQVMESAALPILNEVSG